MAHPDPEWAEALLNKAGFQDVQIRPWVGGRSLSFTALRTVPCICCGQIHAYHSWFCYEKTAGQLVVSSFSEICQPLTLI